MKRILFGFILGSLISYSGLAQNIYVHTMEGLIHEYPLIDVNNIKFSENVMNLNLITGDTISWNISVIRFYEYDQWYVSVPEGLVLDESGLTVYPNPSEGQVNLDYTLLEEAEIALEVFDLKGAFVGSLFRGLQQAGNQHLRWSGTDDSGNQVVNGAYFCQLSVGTVRFNKLIVINR